MLKALKRLHNKIHSYLTDTIYQSFGQQAPKFSFICLFSGTILKIKTVFINPCISLHTVTGTIAIKN